MLISSLLALGLAAAPITGARPAIVVESCEFEEKYQFDTAHCSIQLQNLGPTAVTVSDVRPLRAGDKPLVTSLVVAPRSVAEIRVSVELNNDIGLSKHYFSFNTDEPGQGQRFAEVRGFVTSVLDVYKPTLDFGVVDLRALPGAMTVSLTSRESLGFHAVKILYAPKYLDVALRDSGTKVDAVVRADAAWGVHDGEYIKLETNSPKQREVWIAVKSDVHGEIVPSSNPFAMGLMRTNGSNEFLIRLTSTSGKDFSVGRIIVDRLVGKAIPAPCVPDATGCEMIKFTLDSKQSTGQIGGVLRVELPDFNQVLPIYLWGMLLAPEVEVQDLEELASANASSQGSNASPMPSVKDALRQAVEEAKPLASAAGRGPLIRWAVANEGLIHGYIVYRSLDESGPYLRINDETIKVSNPNSFGSSYQWRDVTAISGSSYWYYIGILRKDGSKEILTRPQEVVAKP